MPAAMTTLVEGGLPVGIVHAELPIPFPVGPVNCWVLIDSPVTVVDPGMLVEGSVDILEAALAEAGLNFGSIDQVVVTHGHPDHCGAAALIADRADAPILCGEAETNRLRLFHPDHDEERRSHYIDLLRSVGVPRELEDTFTQMREMIRDLLQPIESHQLSPVTDGQQLQAGGQTYTAHVTPGHAAGHLSLQHDRTLISGDHLLAHITPNPFIEADPTSPTGRRRSLVEYLESFERFEALDPSVVLPGHGPAFEDVPLLVRGLIGHHEKRADRILELIREHPGSTIYELALAYFSELESYHIVLGVSEIAGHVDLLESRGLLASTGAPQRFEAV